MFFLIIFYLSHVYRLENYTNVPTSLITATSPMIFTEEQVELIHQQFFLISKMLYCKIERISDTPLWLS